MGQEKLSVHKILMVLKKWSVRMRKVVVSHCPLDKPSLQWLLRSMPDCIWDHIKLGFKQWGTIGEHVRGMVEIIKDV